MGFLLSQHGCMSKRYEMVQMDDVDPVRCPCGFAKRAFASPENTTATLHIVDIQSDSKTHYHKKLTEIYLVLEGEGEIELDGERFPVRPMSAIMIKPGCRHRAIGKMKIINVPVPAFDPEDEWFDDENETQ
jgi:mannose-6-phosphate isomerase-like protein (cupin superfamily)